jgi:hypothetical protein
LGKWDQSLDVTHNGQQYPLLIVTTPHHNLRDCWLQLSESLDARGATKGWLIAVDTDHEATWEDKLTWDIKKVNDKTIQIVGC